MKKIIRSLCLVVCLVFVIVLSSSAESRAQESAGEYGDDTVITTKVKSKLLADQELKRLAIKVETSKGVVRLSGLVDTKEQARGQWRLQGALRMLGQ
jgi:Predicted periplasmic or secreted lipoprotein